MEKDSGDTTTVDATEKDIGDTPTVDNMEKDSGDTTTVENTEKDSGDTPTVDNMEKDSGDTTTVENTEKDIDSTTDTSTDVGSKMSTTTSVAGKERMPEISRESTITAANEPQSDITEESATSNKPFIRKNSTIANKPHDDKAPSNDKDDEQPPQICFIGQSSGIFTKKTSSENTSTTTSADAYRRRVGMLQHVSLYSWNLALTATTTTTKRPIIRVPVSGWETNNYTSLQNFRNSIPKFSNIRVDYYNGTDEENQANALIQELILMNNATNDNDRCDWLVVTRLDADDSLTPGYWDYVTDLIVKNHSFDASGAGIVGTKFIPAVETTPNKCRCVIEENQEMVKSQGISAVYRWNVFEKLNFPIRLGEHSRILGQLRKSYREIIQEKVVEPREEEILYDEYDDLAESTGVVYIDTMVEGWGPPALWIRSAMSSHFPWIDFSNTATTNVIPTGCSLQRWKKEIRAQTMGKYTVPFMLHLYQQRKWGNVTLMEACQSNKYFLRFQYIRMNITNKKEAKSCAEFVDLYGSMI